MEEHLYFYGLLKGMDEEDIQNEVDKMIKDVALPHKRTALARDLSGLFKISSTSHVFQYCLKITRLTFIQDSYSG